MSQDDIVRYLEKRKVANTKDIVAAVGLSYGTICSNISTLERHGDIVCVKKERKGRFFMRTWRLKEDGQV